MSNTQKYWHNTKLNRLNQDELPITEERKKIESPRYYKEYKDPKSKTTYNYNTMKNVKDELWYEREKVYKEVQHENPGAEKIPEKINYLVDKKMEKIYKDKFDVLIGNKKEIKMQQKKYEWKDEEIINKIELISG